MGFDLIQIAAADGNARVRYAAISQIASLGHQDATEAESLLRKSLSTDPEPDVQAAAADAIGALGLSNAYQDLAAAYNATNEWLVKFSIVAALGELGNPAAFDLLKDAVNADNELIATAAIGALGELGDERALPILLTYVGDQDWQVRHRLVQALSHFQQPAAQDALQTLAQDESPIVAEAAMHHISAS